MSFAILGILVLLAVVLGVVALVRRSSGATSSKPGDGADILVYLILALAMGVAGFALADLASIAFPGDRFVFDPAEELANSLAALLVSMPFVVFFWRRQAARREMFPASAGWTVYLSIMEAVFMTGFVVTASMFISGLLGGDSLSSWTGAVVFGAIVIFHEWAARVTPPLSDAGELRRVIGSAIGLGAASAGLAGTLAWLFEIGYEALGGVGIGLELDPWIGLVIVGAPVWWYRWRRPWDGQPGVPRVSWKVIAAVVSLGVTLAALTSLLVMAVEYVFGETAPAGQHFEASPLALALALTGAVVWALHRLRPETEPLPTQVYRYVMASIGLVATVGTLVTLTVRALDRSVIVGAGTADIMVLATVLLMGLVVWIWFDRHATRLDETGSPASWPRRIYTLGLGAIFGLVGAGALITTLFILLRRLLVPDATGSILWPGSIFVYTGLATWYLLSAYFRDRASAPPVEYVAPFNVTLICSHPGPIATMFPEQARLRVIYRDDDSGVIDDEMAARIVEEVGTRFSIVWVDADGARVAPVRAI